MVGSVLSGDDCLQNTVIRLNQERIIGGLPPASVSTAALAKARTRLAPDVLVEASKTFARQTLQQAPKDAFWKGLVPFAIDGSTLTANDTRANQKAFPQHANQAEGIGFPLMRMVLLQCLSTGMVHDVAYGPSKGKETGEMALAREVLPNLPDGALLMGDCYFPSFFIMANLMSRGIAGLFPMHFARDVDFRRGKQLHYRDHLVEWTKPPRPSWMTKKEFASYPESLTLRETDLSWKLGKGGSFIVVTTLLDDKEFPRSVLEKFYKKRWKIEVALRDLKDTFGLHHIAAQSPEMIHKVIWAHLLAYNILRWHMLNAASLYGVPSEEVSVQTSARVITHAASTILATPATGRPKLFAALYLQMVQIRVGLRPNRIEPRAVKKRPKPRELLKISRKAWHSARIT